MGDQFGHVTAEQLRTLANQIDPLMLGGPDNHLLRGAADTIDGLTAERDEMDALVAALKAEREHVEAERDRLREALEAMCTAHETGRFEPLQAAYDSARAALKETSDD